MICVNTRKDYELISHCCDMKNQTDCISQQQKANTTSEIKLKTKQAQH